MYKCKACGMQFSTQKKYIKHLEICEVETQSFNSLVLTDIEDDHNSISSYKSKNRSGRSVVHVNDENTKNMIEKLVKDKSKYKAELKSLRNELNNQNLLNHNNYEFLNNQLIIITEDRDDLFEQVEQLTSNEPIIKEKLRLEFSKKLANEKTKVIENYNNKELDTSKLKHDVIMLKTKLDSELNEKEQLKSSLESEIKLTNTKHNNNIQQLQEEVNFLKRNLQQEKFNIQKKVQMINDEKMEDLNLLKTQKEQQFTDLNIEKLTIISELENKIQNMEKVKKNLEDSFNKKLENKQSQLDQEIDNKTKENEKLTKFYENKLEKTENLYDSRVDTLNTKFIQEKTFIESEHTKEFEKFNYEYSTKIKCENDNHKEEIDLLTKKIDNLNVEIEQIIENSKKTILDNTNKYKEKTQQLINNHSDELEKLSNIIKKENIREITEKNNTINDLMVANANLGVKFNTIKLTLENMEKDSLKTKEEFINSLNNQIDKHRQVTTNYDDKNLNLQKEIDSNNKQLNKIIEETQKENISIKSKNLESEQNFILINNTLKETQQKNQILNSTIASFMKKNEELHNKFVEINTQKTILEIQSKNNDSMINKYEINIEHLEKRADTKIKELENINDKFNNMKMKLMETETFFKSSVNELEMSKNEYKILTDNIVALNHKNSCLSNDNELLNNNIIDLNRENKLLSSKNIDTENNYNILNRKFNILSDLAGKLKSQVEDNINLTENYNKKEIDNKNLENKLIQASTKINRLVNNINNSEQKYKKYVDSNNIMIEKINTYEKDISAIKNTVVILESQHVSDTKSKTNIENSLQLANNKLNKIQEEKYSCVSKIKEITNTNEMIKNQFNNINSKWTVLEEQSELQKKNMEQIVSEKEELTNKLSNSELVRSKISQNHENFLIKMKEKNNEVLIENRNNYETQLSEKEKKILQLLETIKHSKDYILEQLNTQRRELLTHYEKDKICIKNELTELKCLNCKLSKDNQDISTKIKQQTKEANLNNEQIRQNYEQKIKDLETEIVNLNKLITNNKNNYLENFNKVTRLSSPEQIELEKLRIDYKNSTELLEQLKLFSTDLQIKYNKLEDKSVKIRQELNDEHAQIEIEKEYLRKKMEEPSDNKLAEENLKKIRDNCLTTLRQRKEEISNLENSLNELQKDFNNIKEKLNITQQELNRTNKQKEILEINKNKRISELENLLTVTIDKIK
tara:strand:- start:148 stop:3768 length:3621 start_codon:yes stop_codon:yes gene_type:complete